VGGAEPLVARLHSNAPLSEGRRYRIGFGFDSVHLFDAETGGRVHGWDEAVGAAIPPVVTGQEADRITKG
jgi:hypothetical protein